MNQQPRSQLQVETEIWINALPDVVWQLLTDVANWHVWNKSVRVYKTSGLLHSGGDFTFLMHQTRIHATVYVANENRSLSWQGISRGITSQRSWFLIPSNGGTLVVSEVRVEGEAIDLAPEGFQRLLRLGAHHWLSSLKQEAEQHVMVTA